MQAFLKEQSRYVFFFSPGKIWRGEGKGKKNENTKKPRTTGLGPAATWFRVINLIQTETVGRCFFYLFLREFLFL